MSRRKRVVKNRNIYPDVIYGDIVVSYFVNGIMKDGKKALAYRLFYESMELLEKKYLKKSGKKGIDVFHEALDKIKPRYEVRSRRVGGMNYQIPREVSESRNQTLAIRWIIEMARKRKGMSFAEKLALEFSDAIKGQGGAHRRSAEMEKMAEGNKAFRHYRW